jgi:hypothetical protein
MVPIAPEEEANEGKRKRDRRKKRKERRRKGKQTERKHASQSVVKGSRSRR